MATTTWTGSDGKINDPNEVKKQLDRLGVSYTSNNAKSQSKPNQNKNKSTFAPQAQQGNQGGMISQLYKDQGWSKHMDQEGIDYWQGRVDNGLTGDALKKEFKQAGQDYLANNHQVPDTSDQTGGVQPPEPTKATSENYTPSIGTSAGYNANTQQVQAPQTVQGQMTGLLSEGSKYLDIARQNAAERANSRGLLNSTMAAGAGERAAIQAAMPIAQQDASTYANQSLTNQGAINQARQFSTGNEQQMNLANMDSTNQARQFNATADMNTSQFNTTQANNMAQNQWSQLASQRHDEVMKNLDTESRAQLIDLESQWSQLIQRDKTASNAYMQAMDSLSRALSQPKLSPEQQKRATQEITGQLSSYFNLLNTMDEGGGYNQFLSENYGQGGTTPEPSGNEANGEQTQPPPDWQRAAQLTDELNALRSQLNNAGRGKSGNSETRRIQNLISQKQAELNELTG